MTDHDGKAPGPDQPHGANPVAAIVIHAGITAIGLVMALQAGLPVAAAMALAWAGGACATVALLLVHDAAIHRGPVGVDDAGRPAPATVPDL